MPRIFISYRRQDSSNMTGRIHDSLKREFGDRSVFRDIYDIPAGSDFRAVLNKEVSQGDIFLAIIGQQWVDITDSQGNRRLDDPNDFVRIEVESALNNPQTRVIPVLVNNANMPAKEELPESLKELCYRNAVKVRTDPDFPHDMEMLIRQIKHSKGQQLTRSLWLILPLLLILLSGFFLFGGKLWNTASPSAAPTITVHPSATAILDLSTPTPLVEPVGPGEIMVLIAQMEQVGTQQREVTRFILQDLKNKILYGNVQIREYPEIIKTDTQASEVAMTTGAVIVIWGRYDDDGSDVYLQLGSLESPPELGINLNALKRMVNAHLRVKHDTGDTLAYPVLSALGFLSNAKNDLLGTIQGVMLLNQLNGDAYARQPEILENTVATHAYKATWTFLSDQETAWNELRQAIVLDLDGANPYLYVFRALISQGVESSLSNNVDSGLAVSSSDDSDAALVYAPKGWIMPYYITDVTHWVCVKLGKIWA